MSTQMLNKSLLAGRPAAPAAQTAGRPALPARVPRRAVAVRAGPPDTQTQEARETAKTAPAKNELEQFSEKIGLPTDEGIFGFKPFAEVWVGRLAMGGFISSILVEATTGRGTLQQVGLVTPSLPLFATILALAGGATTIASWQTIFRATSKQMTANELVRYRQFLGIQNEDKNIADARAAGNPADKLLSRDNKDSLEAGATDAEAGKPSGQEGDRLYSNQDLVTQKQFANEGLAYARDVEVNNGRWAMIGFLSALLVEAGTGKGIIGQLIGYLKFVGLLGEASGF